MKRFSGFKTYFSSICVNSYHLGICYIPGSVENISELDNHSAELFASLDDDDDLMFGYGVEDY